MKTVVNGTNDREALPKRWVAVVVKMYSEKKVGEALTAMDVENYVPVQEEIRQWSDRKKKIEKVVIPTIVFVKTDKETEKRLRMLSFILKVISYPGRYDAAVIPEEQIGRLKFMLRNAKDSVEVGNGAQLMIGERVRVMRGPMQGLEGKLCYNNIDDPKIAIHIEALGYACVRIAREDIEPLPSQTECR